MPFAPYLSHWTPSSPDLGLIPRSWGFNLRMQLPSVPGGLHFPFEGSWGEASEPCWRGVVPNSTAYLTYHSHTPLTPPGSPLPWSLQSHPLPQVGENYCRRSQSAFSLHLSVYLLWKGVRETADIIILASFRIHLEQVATFRGDAKENSWKMFLF